MYKLLDLFSIEGSRRVVKHPNFDSAHPANENVKKCLKRQFPSDRMFADDLTSCDGKDLDGLFTLLFEFFFCLSDSIITQDLNKQMQLYDGKSDINFQ